MRDKMKSKLEKFRLFSKLKSKTFWTYIKCCYKQENHFKFSTFLVSLYHLLEVFCATLSFFVFKKSPKQKRMKPKKHRITFESAGPPHLPFLKALLQLRHLHDPHPHLPKLASLVELCVF